MEVESFTVHEGEVAHVDVKKVVEGHLLVDQTSSDHYFW